MNFTISKGATVSDKITGFVGVVTGRADYVTGCNQYLVQPRGVTKDGSIKSGHWLDEHRLFVDGNEPLLALHAQPAGYSGAAGQAPTK